MSMFDYEGELSDAQEVLATAVSTNVIDLNSYPGYASGEDLFVTATINTAYSGGTSVQAVLYTDTDAVPVTGGRDVITGDAIAVASLTAGATLFQVNLKGLNLSRYIALNYVVVGTPTAGKIDARLQVTPVKGEATLS